MRTTQDRQQGGVLGRGLRPQHEAEVERVAAVELRLVVVDDVGALRVQHLHVHDAVLLVHLRRRLHLLHADELLLRVHLVPQQVARVHEQLALVRLQAATDLRHVPRLQPVLPQPAHDADHAARLERFRERGRQLRPEAHADDRRRRRGLVHRLGRRRLERLLALVPLLARRLALAPLLAHRLALGLLHAARRRQQRLERLVHRLAERHLRAARLRRRKPVHDQRRQHLQAEPLAQLQQVCGRPWGCLLGSCPHLAARQRRLLAARRGRTCSRRLAARRPRWWRPRAPPQRRAGCGRGRVCAPRHRRRRRRRGAAGACPRRRGTRCG